MTGRIERLQKAFEINVQWTAFPLHPDTPAEGRTLEDLFAGRGVDVDQMMAHLKQAATELGLLFGDRKMTYNSRLAQEMGKWAESNGKGDEFHDAVFRAYFADGRNIATATELEAVAVSVGLNGKDARKIIQERPYKDAVDLDWKRSHELNIRAVPTFVLNDDVLVGAQKYEALEMMLLSNDAKRRN
ncbi:MAG: DsbA family protein [Deltaproteobacteria bacterium]|nr:DsbA family protein [Deltaproteobacteria bacterium]